MDDERYPSYMFAIAYQCTQCGPLSKVPRRAKRHRASTQRFMMTYLEHRKQQVRLPVPLAWYTLELDLRNDIPREFKYEFQDADVAQPNAAMVMRIRRKSLLIGINYIGTKHQLKGCINDVQNMAAWLVSRGYSSSPRDMIFLTDERKGPYYPNAHNILAAMDWLVSDPGCALFLHYSGHGGQVPDAHGVRKTGFNDTIVPVDYERAGMIDSSTLHKHLVSRLPSNCTLFVLFDCCHSGSAIELPYVYRSDASGTVKLLDNLQAGKELVSQATHLLQGGISFNQSGEAAELLGGAKDFFKGLKHQFDDEGGDTMNGLASAGDFAEDWSREGKSVFMFSGCKDTQTSSDAVIAGRPTGAMSWAFLETMRKDVRWNMSYLQILEGTKQMLQAQYSQIPQLSCGYPFDLHKPFHV